MPTSTSSSRAANLRQERRDRAAPANRVAIDARDARAGKLLANLGLDALGAEPDELDELARRSCDTSFGNAIE